MKKPRNRITIKSNQGGLFGSYLTNIPEINGVDIAIEVNPKVSSGELLDQQLQRRREELEKRKEI